MEPEKQRISDKNMDLIQVSNSVDGEKGVSCTGLSSEYTLATIYIQLHSYKQARAIR